MQSLQSDLNAFLSDAGYNAIGEHNAAIKQVRKLLLNTKPNPEKLFIAEGIWIHDKLLTFDIDIKTVFVCPELVRIPETVKLIKDVSVRANVKYVISEKVLSKISERDKPDGLISIACLPQRNISDFSCGNRSTVLVLDGVEIPGNIGTMLRTSDATGIDAVFICNKRARLTHPKLIKGSMGAVLSVPIFEFESIEECHNWLLAKGFTIYLADTSAKHYYYEESFKEKTAIIMGSEKYGISKGWYVPESILISIPMMGNCDSLNVGVAATVLTYERVRQAGGRTK